LPQRPFINTLWVEEGAGDEVRVDVVLLVWAVLVVDVCVLRVDEGTD
jgi:hypothetical protein